MIDGPMCPECGADAMLGKGGGYWVPGCTCYSPADPATPRHHEIRLPEDVTADHIEEAASMRAGEYGGEVIPWADVIDRLERGSDDDWGDQLDSPAIRHLKREVGILLRGS